MQNLFVEVDGSPVHPKKRAEVIEDYTAFLKKFEHKKTTDDCYTPPAVYNAVLDWVNEHYPLAGKRVLRPFYPGGDYKSVEYAEDCVVIDNPPFSIIAEITKFYIEGNIPFFIFAPHLTLFSSDLNCSFIVCDTQITYENGAVVNTSFRSNILGDWKVIGAPDLKQRIKAAQVKKKAQRPKYEYPENVLTVSKVAYFVSKGINIRIHKNDLAFCRTLDMQLRYKKAIFGGGFLLSLRAAAEMTKTKGDAKDGALVWELSEREWEIIRGLG
mgnify:CR=1 FL=1